MTEYIVINGIKFAPSKAAMIDTLFQKGGTASGFYKRESTKSITLYDAQGVAFAHISRNSHGESFFGNARQLGRKIFKQVALSSHLEKYFGIDALEYSAQCAFADALAAKYLK